VGGVSLSSASSFREGKPCNYQPDITYSMFQNFNENGITLEAGCG